MCGKHQLGVFHTIMFLVWSSVMKWFCNLNSAAPDGNVFERVTMLVDEANQAAKEHTHHLGLILLSFCSMGKVRIWISLGRGSRSC